MLPQKALLNLKSAEITQKHHALMVHVLTGVKQTIVKARLSDTIPIAEVKSQMQ